MSFTRSTFCGCSVRGFSTQLGWNGQHSQLSVQLVVDPANGDVWAPPPIGSPAYFSFYSLNFFGIFQKYEEKKGSDGLPVYDIIVVDPREILEGAQVIIGGYNGGVQGVYNLFNVYGYWESLGFGGSLINDSGMPWYLIKGGLLALANQPAYKTYGGPLTFKGVKYGLDLTQLPTMPNFYRIGGGHNMSILEIITRICEDAGHEFFIELVGYTIKIKTVSRRVQPPLGTIAALTNSGYGTDLVRSSDGLELRNEVTTAFLVGSEVSVLHQTDGISSFWGYKSTGEPILGQANRINFKKAGFTARLRNPITPTDTIGIFDNWADVSWPQTPMYMLVDNEIIKLTGDWIQITATAYSYNFERAQFGTTATSHSGGATMEMVLHSLIGETMTLNSSVIADIIGTVDYPCDTIELRLAKVNFDSWAAYMVHYKSTMATAMGITSPIRGMGANRRLAPDLINDRPADLRSINRNAITTDANAKQMRCYEFVKSHADEYMGRKFAVSLPFILFKQDVDTLKVSKSYDISEGGYLPDGSSPLGLSLLNEDVFKIQDGRFKCFVNFTNLTNVDLSYISNQGTVIENGLLFMEAHADPNIIFVPLPAAVITLQGPVLEKATDSVGDITVIGAVLQENAAVANQILGRAAFGILSARVSPATRKPILAAIPLKSNILTYGPWTALGTAGKVRVEQDSSLNPWNYGGYASMNQAALARVNDALTNMQVSETGSIERAGPPTISLGGVLQANGPNCTNIDVSFGTNGVTTTYRFQTYTSRFGVLSKLNAEKFKTMSKTSQELRRAVRTQTRENLAQGAIAVKADLARRFMQNAPPMVRRESPHEVFVAQCVPLGSGELPPRPGSEVAGTGDGYIVRTGVSTATHQEALAFTNANNTDYEYTAMMGLNGLLRPFSTEAGHKADDVMSSLVTPSIDCDMNVTNLNPWKDKNDIEVYLSGTSCEGLHAFRMQEEGQTPYTYARPMALRGPLVISGWGYNWDGTPIGEEEE